ncbi:MAG: hypothetical protein IK057_04120 [Clostridia bacterium]|nr:hypothetical protein [Clostridia bacterium]
MDENKEFEKMAEEVKETAEEIAEEVKEIAEDVQENIENAAEDAEGFAQDIAEEVKEEAEEIAEDVAEAAAEVQEFAGDAVETAKKSPLKAIITALIVIILAVFCILLGLGKFPKLYNKYNHMGYVNITGRTIADIAEESGMELSDFIEQYGLPADMPGNTQESAAYYTMPVSSIANMYGMSFDDLKELLGFGDDVTEDTAWGKAEGEITLEKYIGEDNFEEFKEKYGFGDEVTLETKWKEVRKTVDLEAKKAYEERNAANTEEEADSEETAAEEEVEEVEEEAETAEEAE